MATTYRARLKQWLGAPLMDVELDEKEDLNDKNYQDDYDLIEERVLRVVSTFFPCEYILTKPIPAAGSVRGNGFIDLSDEDIITLKEVYCIKSKVDAGDVLLPWSMVRIWEKIWVGASEFVGADLLLYKNELASLAQASDNVFSWKWYEAERRLYVCNVPSWTTNIGIVALKAVDKVDHICTKQIEYDLCLRLGAAYAKQMIGAKMRKYKVEGMDMPGQSMVDEGKTEEKDVVEKIEEYRYYPGGL